MNKLRAKAVSTLHTARLVSGLFIVAGGISIVLAMVIPHWQKSLLSRAEGEQMNQLEQLIVQVGPLGVSHVVTALAAAVILIWMGYLLRTVVVLTEAQLWDLTKE